MIRPNRVSFLKGYERILIDNVPSQLVRDRVTVCVDFIRTVPMTYFENMLMPNLGGRTVFAG